jgi:hypothetical protein
MLVMEEIFLGLASMPHWLMMKPSSLPEGTPKAHLFGLSFQRYSRRDAKVSSRSSMRVLIVWTSLGPLPQWVPGPTTRWAPGTTRLALHGT